jgi:ubiquinone/menaquinone biosynthesis C-methylase UbiE|tara:strand:- start:929 stop:1612 length:684 start_codon:yes stop_codon:yes gene_type:complete
MTRKNIHEEQKAYWERKQHVIKRRDPSHPVIQAFAEPKINHILSKINLPDSPRVIDVGAGNGYFSYWWEKRGNLTAIDYSATLLENNPVEQKMQMDARDLTFDDNTFDLSFCNAVLHHVDKDDRATVVKEMARVSTNYVAIIEPNIWNPLVIGLALAMKEERGCLAFTKGYTQKLMEEAGLTVIHSCAWGILTPNRLPIGPLLPLFNLFERPMPCGFITITVGKKGN